MITDSDVTKLKKTFATKKDLARLERKTAKGFLDIQRQINRNTIDISGIKSDNSSLKSDVSTLKSDVSCLKKDVAEIKEHMLSMELEILTAIENLRTENMLVSTYIPKINDHENRITKLESASPI